MSDERRVATLDMVLIELGVIKNGMANLSNETSKLADKIKTQNGRVDRLELDQAKREGVLMTIKLFMIPPLLGIVWFIVQFFLNYIIR